jgi:DNA repair photolyase
MEDGKEFQYSEDFKLAIQLKSWMSINPSYGCIWDCGYCIQEKDKFFSQSEHKKVHKVASPEDVVAEIMSNPRISSKTPLTFHNFSDPFLPHNTSDLVKILTELDDRKFTNIVGLISRTYADCNTLDVIAGLSNLKPIVLVTYAGYENQALDRGPTGMRVKLIEELEKRKVPTLLYLRPVVKEWLEPGQFAKVRNAVGHLVDGVVMSGIRITPEIAEKLRKNNLIVPQVPNYTNKFFPKELQEEIITTFDNVTPVYRYTSCGVCATLGVPDFNVHFSFMRETQGKCYENCPIRCKPGQSEICKSIQKPEEKYVRNLLARLNLKDISFTISDSGAVYLDKQVPKIDLTFLRHNLLVHVDYVGNKHHIDQVASMEVKSQI